MNIDETTLINEFENFVKIYCEKNGLADILQSIITRPYKNMEGEFISIYVSKGLPEFFTMYNPFPEVSAETVCQSLYGCGLFDEKCKFKISIEVSQPETRYKVDLVGKETQEAFLRAMKLYGVK